MSAENPIPDPHLKQLTRENTKTLLKQIIANLGVAYPIQTLENGQTVGIPGLGITIQPDKTEKSTT